MDAEAANIRLNGRIKQTQKQARKDSKAGTKRRKDQQRKDSKAGM